MHADLGKSCSVEDPVFEPLCSAGKTRRVELGTGDNAPGSSSSVDEKQRLQAPGLIQYEDREMSSRLTERATFNEAETPLSPLDSMRIFAGEVKQAKVALR